jgi:glycerol-3-phosphate acyltransferase PlsY
VEFLSDISVAFFIAVYSYFFGSIPFGKIFGLIKRVDIQKKSSGKTGATNVGRVLGKKWGILVFILDAGKSVAAIAITHCYFPGPWHWSWAPEFFAGVSFLFVIVGHIFPVWLKFKGGAGVSSFVGGLLGLFLIGFLDWRIILILLFAWIFVLRFLARRQMSTTNLLFLAGILISVAFIPILIAMGFFMLIIVLMIWWGHRDNLKRISEGREPSMPLRFFDKIPVLNRITDDGFGWLICQLEKVIKKIRSLNGRPV